MTESIAPVPGGITVPVETSVPVEEAVSHPAEPPITGATAAIGASAVVVTWHLSRPLGHESGPVLLTVWLPRHGEGPIQLGLEVEPPRTRAFCVDFQHRQIIRGRDVRARITEGRIVAMFPLDWVRGLEPIEVSHTGASIEQGAVVKPELQLRFDIVSTGRGAS